MSAIPARYAGTCPECGGRWQPGDLITPGPHEEQEWPAKWRHANCPDSGDPTALRAGETVCTTCWLVHPPGTCGQ